MKEPQKQYDAVAWIDRLREVNEKSEFTPSEKALIEDELSKLQQALRRLQQDLQKGER